MSTPESQEHSFVKVLFDFQYKTNEGREISIKKNERLYLLQKTNADWWQVVRTWEQRSFYVPATYVREISKLTRKNSEEERDNSTSDPPDGPKYKNMPKETSSAMRNVKRWLAGAIDSRQETSKSHSPSDDSYKHNAMDYQSRAELKVGLAAIKSKSLERERKLAQMDSQSDREETRDRRSSKEVDKKFPNTPEPQKDFQDPLKMAKNFSTSPKSFDIPNRLEMPFQDGFRKELESSLDRRRKISNSTDYDKLIQQNREVDSKSKILTQRVRTISSRSDDSLIESDLDDRTDRSEPKVNSSLREDSKGRLSPTQSKRNSRSLDFEVRKIGQRTERSLSPKPIYGRQLTIAGGNIGEDTTSQNVSGDHRILSDKRRTWAVEELMTELTQMCKERVTPKKPNFQIKTTDIKTSFDPLDELTRELHEMNLLRSEGNTPQIENRSLESSSGNISRVSFNRNDKSPERSRVGKLTLLEEDEPSEQLLSTEKSVFSFKNVELPLSQTKPLRSPKSPKILDEYNEANILNDSPTSPNESLDDARSLSSDKEVRHQQNSVRSEIERNHESPSYSNLRMKSSENVKLRPKIKIKQGESQGELKLTPSLEKLASEIQFIPSKKACESSDNDVKSCEKSPRSANIKVRKGEQSGRSADDHVEKHEVSDKIILDDSGVRDMSGGIETERGRGEKDWEKFRNKLVYTGSFKTKREGKYFYRNREGGDIDDDGWKSGLKKSSTMHYTTVPESYRRYKRDDDSKMSELNTFKRRSRSLSDLRSLEEDDDELNDNSLKINGFDRESSSKPIPLPRTKIPAFEVREKVKTAESIDKHVGLLPSAKKIEKEIPRNVEDIWIPRVTNFPSKVTTFPRGFNQSLDIESSTAVGFKTLLCTSDSGSDNCLQSKGLLESADELEDNFQVKKLRLGARTMRDDSRTRESFSDELVLSSNASSEALQSQSESEVTAGLDASSSPVNARERHEEYECNIELPAGWTQKYDPQSEQMCFINEHGDRWFSSNDAEGKIYFFEENSNESSWVLPTNTDNKHTPTKPSIKSETIASNSKSNTPSSNTEITLPKNTPPKVSITQPMPSSSNLTSSHQNSSKKLGTTSNDWPQLSFDGNMRVLKEGQISRTKITENGKKLRKNWSTSYAVLTELFLLFFKDSKTFTTMMKSGQSAMAKPDISVDLNGALIELGDRASSRKNVYMISTVLGLQVLIQSDNTALAAEWFQEIHGVIRKLPSGFKYHAKPPTGAPEVRKISNSKSDKQESNHDDSKKGSKVARSRSMKTKRLDDSLEDLSGPSADKQTKIKAKLKKFFLRRPTVEYLVKNGIYKDEPAFGSYLQDVCPTEYPRVPLFVKTCIEVLESNEDNMKTDGLYRASGNLSQIQKIRLQVDQYNLSVLSQEEDVHVLTGALKLFFRELKEPLIPSSFFKEALNASMLRKSSAKVQCFREIVKALPTPNHDTLQFLLKHLLKVTSYQEFNRMDIPNLAIVCGPTLMWPAEESANMALELMQQNLVIECLLSEYNKIFK